MECASVQERLRDLARGQLDASDESEVRRHLAGCERCRHEEQAERSLDQALSERLGRLSAPTALRHRITEHVALARSQASAQAGRHRRAATRAAVASLAALVVAVLGFVAGGAARGRTLATERLADEAVTDHLRALAATHPYDVPSSSSHEVKPWFAGRLDFAPIVPGDRGELRLLGGSLGYVLDRKAAVLSYALRRHQVTLLAFQREPVPAGGRVPPEGPPLRVTRRGFTVAFWSAGDVAYALVSDVEPAELGRLADELAAETRRGPSPG
jgi:anti-sigma factor RsiW